MENKNKLKEVQRQNKIVVKYAEKWKKIVLLGILRKTIWMDYMYLFDVFSSIGQYNKKVQPQKRASKYKFSRKKITDVIDEDNLDEIRKQGNVIEMRFNYLVKKKETVKAEDNETLAGLKI